MGDQDPPYALEYAKSNRSKCKHCKEFIAKDDVRIAIMVQSNFHDGKDPQWHHQDCFFKNVFPDKISAFSGFLLLKQEDQKKILDKIELISANTKTIKHPKRSIHETEIDRYLVQYSKNNLASCRACLNYIEMNDIRIYKAMYNTHITRTHGIKQELFYYHLKCFVQNRSKLHYFGEANKIPGFHKLRKFDQKYMIQLFEEIPLWKMAKLPENKSKKLQKFNNQNELFHGYLSTLQDLEDTVIESVIKVNSQTMSKTRQEKLILIADMMAFGALEPCPKCTTGRQLVLETNGYKCTGHVSEYSVCTYVTQNPKRRPMKVPKECKDLPCFKDYKPKKSVRLFLSDKELVRKIKPKQEGPQPLKNFKFLLRGTLKRDNNFKKRILKLGGLVVHSKMWDLAAVVCPDPEDALIDSDRDDISDCSDEYKMLEEEYFYENNIDIVHPSFLDKIEKKKKVSCKMAAKIIADSNYFKWGGDAERILETAEYGESGSDSSESSDETASQSTSMSLTTSHLGQAQGSDTGSDTWKKVMGGGIVEPESGLQEEARILTDSDNVKYTASLCKSDVSANKNSFYKLQALEKHDKTRYWVFRSWGRLGYPKCSFTLNDAADATEAIEKFKQLFQEKTNNAWENRDNFQKAPGYYQYIKYGSEMVSNLDIDPECTVPMPVQKLIRYILDADNMKNIMNNFKIDIEKMPLGKLAKEQIESGYAVLGRLRDHIKKKDGDKIVDDTNRFYTIIPHIFGLKNAPLLDNENEIENKILLLDNLLEIENAYRLMSAKGSGSVIEEQYKKFKSDITPLDPKSDEYKMILKYAKNTHGPSHTNYTLAVLEVFKVNRDGEEERYNKFRSLHNRRLLWHGSRTVNFAGILPEGLRIRPANALLTANMFGNGIYFADMISKSANYCNVTKDNPTGLMLLCEVALGNMDKRFYAEKSALPAGCHSRWGVGRTHPDPRGRRALPCGTLVPLGKPVPNPEILNAPKSGTLYYNEFIVYDVEQVNIKYLIKMKFNFK